MNDYLLESRKKDRNPTNLQSLRLNEANSENFIPVPETPRSPTKNSTAYKVLTVERQAKIKVTFNNIRLVLLFSIIPFVVIISTFGNTKLFLMATDNLETFNYWVNFIFIQKQYQDPQQANDLGVAETVYTYVMLLFYYEGCQGNGTDGDPSGLCGAMGAYYYSGLFASIAVLLGLIFHIIHFWQLARIILSKDPNVLKGFNPMIISYFIIFLYGGSFVYWIFGSATPINFNAKGSVFERFGSTFYCYIAACLVFIIVAMWLRRVYKKGIRRNLVNNLLNAEKKYVDSLESLSVGGESEKGN